MKRDERILDPIHGLILFRKEEAADCLAWALINTREFQRLRGIRQLGLSELVFPGATHSRFAHCIGVFHTARQLLGVLRRKQGSGFDEEKARTALCAALLHDIGHGPFSHAFERVGGVRHEAWTGRVLLGETAVCEILESFEKGLSRRVADLVAGKRRDIYAAIVTSQFDADRLDYLRRDRYMTGMGSSGFDFNRLLDCLEVSEESLCLTHKGLRNAEEYLLARYNLYAHVYTHKTVRCAETMLAAILRALEAAPDAGGLEKTHPLRRFYEEPSDLERYLALDDISLWQGLGVLGEGGFAAASIARRLLRRDLFACFDAGEATEEEKGSFLRRLEEKRIGYEADSVSLSIYKQEEESVLILDGKGENPRDIATFSRVIQGLAKGERLLRVYFPASEDAARAAGLWK